MTIRNMTLIGLLGFGIVASGCTNTAPAPVADTAPPVADTTAPSPQPETPADTANTPQPGNAAAPVANAGTTTVKRTERVPRQQPVAADADNSSPAPAGEVDNSQPPAGYGNNPPPPAGYGDTAPPPEIIVETAPPPIRFERIVPRLGYVWTPGYWRWDGNNRRHVWVGGSYVSARPGFDWAPGRWEHAQNRGWRFHAGYWVPRGSSAPPHSIPVGNVGPGAGINNTSPPPPRREPVVQRPGFVWTPGYWQWSGNRYAWVAGSYVSARPGFMWTPGRWERGPNGGWRFDQGRWTPRDAGPPVSSGPAMGNGSIIVAPPAPRIEPVVARPGMVWTPGYWQWDGNRYAWVGGAYVAARPGFVWVRHHWVQGPRGGWHLEVGHWQQR